MHTDGLDVAGGELLERVGGGAAHGGAEAAQETEANTATTLQMGDDALLESGDHGTDVVGSDGTLLADLFGEFRELDYGHGGCHRIEDGLFGLEVLAFYYFVLHRI